MVGRSLDGSWGGEVGMVGEMAQVTEPKEF